MEDETLPEDEEEESIRGDERTAGEMEKCIMRIPFEDRTVRIKPDPDIYD